MTEHNTTNSLLNNSLSQGLGIVGGVFYMTVDESHSHGNSSENSVCTIETFIDQITLEDRVGKKHKTIVKATPKRSAPATWNKLQMATFAQLLSTFGSDFEMIARRMGKSREQVKRKFKVLEKKHPHLADVIFNRQHVPVLQSNEFLQ